MTKIFKNNKLPEKNAKDLLNKIITENNKIRNNKLELNQNLFLNIFYNNMLSLIKLICIFYIIYNYLLKYIVFINFFVYLFYNKLNYTNNMLYYYTLLGNEKICKFKYYLCKSIYKVLPLKVKDYINNFKLYLLNTMYSNILMLLKKDK